MENNVNKTLGDLIQEINNILSENLKKELIRKKSSGFYGYVYDMENGRKVYDNWNIDTLVKAVFNDYFKTKNDEKISLYVGCEGNYINFSIGYYLEGDYISINCNDYLKIKRKKSGVIESYSTEKMTVSEIIPCSCKNDLNIEFSKYIVDKINIDKQYKTECKNTIENEVDEFINTLKSYNMEFNTFKDLYYKYKNYSSEIIDKINEYNN